MISIGGKTINSTESAKEPLPEWPDPWHNGIGIFDMTAMEWKAKYDANAGPYVTPDVVKRYYQKNGRFPAKWDNDLVKGWFTETKTESGNSTTAADDPPITSTPASVEETAPSKIGAIAGGTVGVVAALALVGLLGFFLVRRQRRQRRGAEKDDYKFEKPEDGNEGTNTVFQDTLSPSELSGTNEPVELPQREVATTELPMENQRYEAMETQRYEAMDTSRSQKTASLLS